MDMSYVDLVVLGGYDRIVRSLNGLVSLLPSYPLGMVFIDGVILACHVCNCVWVCVWWWVVGVGSWLSLVVTAWR